MVQCDTHGRASRHFDPALPESPGFSQTGWVNAPLQATSQTWRRTHVLPGRSTRSFSSVCPNEPVSDRSTRRRETFIEPGDEPDAPEGRTRREIIARQRGLKIFRSVGTRRDDLDPQAALSLAGSLPEPRFRTRGPWCDLDRWEASRHCGQINPFSPARRRPTVDHSLVPRGTRRHPLQACLPDGHEPQCLSFPYPRTVSQVNSFLPVALLALVTNFSIDVSP